MVLIDSPTDLIATASRQIPQLDMKMERFGLAASGEEPEQQTQFSSNDYDYLSSWQDIYLRGAYEKRVEDLEKFAQDKNFWAAASGQGEDFNYLGSHEDSRETGRRQRYRPFQGGSRPLRVRRPIAQRRKESGDYEKDGTIYDYVDPLTFSDVYGSPSTHSEDHHPYQAGPGYLGDQDKTITRRVADAIFNPLSSTIFTIVAIPLVIAAVYWLFVVNGPTPVVKARIEEMPLQDDIPEEKFDWDQFNDILLQALKVFVPVKQQN